MTETYWVISKIILKSISKSAGCQWNNCIGTKVFSLFLQPSSSPVKESKRKAEDEPVTSPVKKKSRKNISFETSTPIRLEENNHTKNNNDCSINDEPKKKKSKKKDKDKDKGKTEMANSLLENLHKKYNKWFCEIFILWNTKDSNALVTHLFKKFVGLHILNVQKSLEGFLERLPNLKFRWKLL